MTGSSPRSFPACGAFPGPRDRRRSRSPDPRRTRSRPSRRGSTMPRRISSVASVSETMRTGAPSVSTAPVSSVTRRGKAFCWAPSIIAAQRRRREWRPYEALSKGTSCKDAPRAGRGACCPNVSWLPGLFLSAPPSRASPVGFGQWPRSGVVVTGDSGASAADSHRLPLQGRADQAGREGCQGARATPWTSARSRAATVRRGI